MSNTPPRLGVAALRAADRTPPETFGVTLDDGRFLTINKVRRLLPGRRLAAEACWGDGPCFAKLFFGKSAHRQGERERTGLVSLHAAGIASPSLLYAGNWDAQGYVVISEWLPEATVLEEDSPVADIDAAFALLGQLHRAGLVHRDGHPGNFLKSGDSLQVIDGDGIAPASQREDARDNLALFAAQFPARWPELKASALAAYGWPADDDSLAPRVDAALHRRLSAFLPKTLRECSEFVVHQDLRRRTVVRRDALEALKPLFADLDTAMAGGAVLKAGGTCTVARVGIGDTAVVVKRYNLKHWRHALSRAWRPSRASHSWIEGHRLVFLGIPTPRPLALVEERLGPLRGRAYLIAEAQEGASLLEVLHPDSPPAGKLAASLLALFARLFCQRIVHGDLKATNLLWNGERLALIDLDATTERRSPQRFRQAWQRDRARFLRNWPADSALVTWLDERLPNAR